MSGSQRREREPDQEKSLHQFDPYIAQDFRFLRRLDPLEDNPDAKIAQHMQPRSEDQALHAVGVDVADQLQVDLDDAGLELGQQTEAGIPGPKSSIAVRKPMAPVGALDVQQMRGLALFRHGELEIGPLQPKARLQGAGQPRPYAGFRSIDGIWQEIDGQQATLSGDPRVRSELGRLYPARLIECMPAALADHPRGVASTASIRAANKRFVG